MKKIPRFVAPITWRDLNAARGDAFSPTDIETSFERRFAEYLGVEHAIVAPSGRLALRAILQAFDFRPGDEVIMPALTFFSVPAMVKQLGLRPVFVDIDPATYCLDVRQLPAAIGPRTVAIVPTHLYGRACDMTAIRALADRHGLAVIEDCAQSCGGRHRGQRLGSFGDAAFFSFGSTKNLSALGAGMAVLRKADHAEMARRWISGLPLLPRFQLAKRVVMAMAMRAAAHQLTWRAVFEPSLRLFARFGLDPIEKLTEEAPSGNSPGGERGLFRPHPFQSQVGLLQLEKLDAANDQRRHNGNLLLDALRGVDGVVAPVSSPDGDNIFMSFPIRVEQRDAFRREMRRLGVDTASGYMSVCPHLPGLGDSYIEAPAASMVVRQMAHLPVYPELELSDIQFIADCARRVCGTTV